MHIFTEIKPRIYTALMNPHFFGCKTSQSENRLDNGVVSINFSRTFFTGIGHVFRIHRPSVENSPTSTIGTTVVAAAGNHLTTYAISAYHH